MIFHEGSRWFLLLVALVPLIWWRHLRRGRRPALLFSSVQPLTLPPATWAVAARHVVPLLRTMAVILLIVCLARPQKGNEQTRIFAEGVAIQMLVDRSGSMQAMDFHVDGKPVNRLTAVKKVAREFVFGTGADFSGRPDDLIGLIVFGTYADSLCPLTLDHDHLMKTLDDAKIPTVNAEMATAIGAFADALGEFLSPARLKLYERILASIPEQRDLNGKMRLTEARNLTLIHEDAHPGNVFFPKDPETHDPFLIDWQMWRIQIGTHDIAYMFVLAGYPDRRGAVERSLVEHYHQKLIEAGVGGYKCLWSTCSRPIGPYILKLFCKGAAYMEEALHMVGGQGDTRPVRALFN